MAAAARSHQIEVKGAPSPTRPGIGPITGQRKLAAAAPAAKVKRERRPRRSSRDTDDRLQSPTRRVPSLAFSTSR